MSCASDARQPDLSLPKGLNGWDAYCQQNQSAQKKSLPTNELENCLDDNHVASTTITSSFFSKQRNSQQNLIQCGKSVEQHQWGHLRYAAEELCPDVGFMEEVFTKLVDSKKALNTKERLNILQKLSKVLNANNVLKLCMKTHSRRQVMFALDFLWQEKQTRFHVNAVVSKMFEQLHCLIEADAQDMVFAKKFHVFHNLISSCNMQQVIHLARSLLRASRSGVGSTLGLAIIRRLIERADSMDFRSSAYWLDDCLPGLAMNVLCVSDIKAAYQILGAVTVKHLLNNLSMDHEMFRNGSE